MAGENNSLSVILVNLLRGVIYRDDDLTGWQQLLDLQGAVQDYLTVIGLKLELDEQEGFAFVRNRERDEDETYPQLIVRRQRSYPVSLLLAQLRRKLTEHMKQSSKLKPRLRDLSPWLKI